MNDEIHTNTADAIAQLGEVAFSFAYDRFCRGVRVKSGRDFTDFGSGLPFDWEGYKDWVYLEGRGRLGLEGWKKSDPGNGKILNSAIMAIEIHSGPENRNNLVQWDARYGDQGRSHKALLDARTQPDTARAIESALYKLYRGERKDEGQIFEDLISLLGKRYDLLAYLFFLKDWTRFMPIKPERFSEAFEHLGISFKMSGRCSWENYQGYMARLHLVREKLSEFQVLGNRLIDAHSFCWILAALWESDVPQVEPEWIRAVPLTASRPIRDQGGPDISVEKTGEDYLREAETKQELGALAQSRVLEAEITRLRQLGRPDLADRVTDVSGNPVLGYDIESYFEDGAPKRIEVKAAATGMRYWRFYLSENEREKSMQLNGYVFALVEKVRSDQPRIWEFPAKELPTDSLHAVTYQVFLQTP
ncbi:MAG: DUF3883 domain-containing protein [Gammaproteobacteria bacterium]|nr:DUF3883 domain-containing protein [Gammaproteobacteria bacterium]